jgi:translation initiation factor 2B subunit (eIF-2B alpha/beta/delta family)
VLTVENQLELAKETVNLIEAYVKQAKIRPPVTLDSYIDYIKQKAKIVNKDPLNFVVLNVIRRILALSRQKYNEEGPNRG